MYERGDSCAEIAKAVGHGEHGVYDKFEITMWRNKDKRYATVDAPSSITIDDFILENLPHDLDIVQHKIYKVPKQTKVVCQ